MQTGENIHMAAIACLQSQDAGDMRNSDGGQEVSSSYGWDGEWYRGDGEVRIVLA